MIQPYPRCRYFAQAYALYLLVSHGASSFVTNVPSVPARHIHPLIQRGREPSSDHRYVHEKTVAIFSHRSASPEEDSDPEDTVRVRIWRALASGKEMGLPELLAAVNAGASGKDDEMRDSRITRSDLRHHLTHVERQAKTLANKSGEWRERRGLPREGAGKKLKLRKRRGGPRGETFLKLG